MLFFVTTTLILLFVSFQEIGGTLKRSKRWIYFISCALWVFSFIRWEVGTDWDSYYEIYEECDYIEWYEWGFFFFFFLVKHTVDNYLVLFFILGGIFFYFQT